MRLRFASVATFLLLLAVTVPVLAAPETATPPAPAAESEAAAPDAQERESVLAFVEELRAEAARIRGLAWKYEVPADFLSREQLAANMLETFEKEIEPEERERDTRIMRRMGLIGPDEDPYELILEAMTEMVGGYFDPEEKHLYLIEGMTGDAQKPVVLHELIHALEDQYLDLKARMEALENDPDRLFAEKVVGEGSAEHGRILYERDHPDVSAAYAEGQNDQGMAQRQMKIMGKVPAFLLLPTLMHYQLGPVFVARAVGSDYPGGMKALYEDPPVSQEQVLHPIKFFGEQKDYPHAISWSADFAELAGEGWEKVHDLTAGELDLAFYLDFFLGFTKGKINPLLLMQQRHVVPEAEKAAAGWDGGRSYFMEKEGLPAAWIEATIFDTVEDAEEAMDALLKALRKMNGAAWVEGEEIAEIEEGTDDAGTGFEPVGPSVISRSVSWVGKAGPARLMRRGKEVILVDGVPAALFETVWAAAASTSFVRDERDTWDPDAANDVLAACDWSDAKAGIGVVLPSDVWSIRGDDRVKDVVARASRPGVVIEIRVIAAPVAMLQQAVQQQLEAGFGTVTRGDTVVAGASGTRWNADGDVFYLGGAGRRSVMLRAQGNAEVMVSARDEIERLVAEVVVVEE